MPRHPRRRRPKTARDLDACQIAYANALQLHNQTAEKFGGIAEPKGEPIAAYRAWHRVLDAWEVAEDACLEVSSEEDKKRWHIASGNAGSARHLHKRIVTTLRAYYLPEHNPSDPIVYAERHLKVAQRLEARYGLADSDVRQYYTSAAASFRAAGRPRRARAIERYVRRKTETIPR